MGSVRVLTTPQLMGILATQIGASSGLSALLFWMVEGRSAGPEVLGLAITALSHESRVEEICEGLDTNALGFDP